MKRSTLPTHSTRPMLRRLSWLLLCLLMVTLTFSGSAVLAQDELPPRNEYVFHVYVDPIFGDDLRATQENPGDFTSLGYLRANPLPLDFHPDGYTDTHYVNGFIGGLLQHAPFAFKTLTRKHSTGPGGPLGMGALDYITRLFTTTPPAPKLLPWTNPHHSKVVGWVVIHCLPGLYGPVEEGRLPAQDPESGLLFNGEPNLPVSMIDHVSLQGTSALDTIFDARHEGVAVIEVNIVTGEELSFVETFIDSLTIRGARSDGLSQQPLPAPRNSSGAGIYIGREANIHLTVGNCFITDNLIGIALDGDEDQPTYINRPVIVNNTIARNAVGIWNGNTAASQDPVGLSMPVLLNNVIDSGNSVTGDIGRISGFEGLHPDDLTVNSRTGAGTPPQSFAPGQDFNAWEVGRGLVNTGTAVGLYIGSNWRSTDVRAGGTLPALLSPRVDIQPYTNATSSGPLPPRGSLYINDLFRNAGKGLGSPNPPYPHPKGLSGHDFRLAPQVSTSIAAPNVVGTPGTVNPLVNRGIHLPDPWDTITMNNGSFISIPIDSRYPGPRGPGIHNKRDFPAHLHAWDYDGEGYGNLRAQARSGFGTIFPHDLIDIGADEFDELVMAGFLDGTRIFSAVDSTHTPTTFVSHDKVYFFDLYLPGGSYLRPQANFIAGSIPGAGYDWWNHAVLNPQDLEQVLNPARPSNYTAGIGTISPPLADSYVRLVHYLTNAAFIPSMRNLECDISPHLLPDWHHYATGINNNPPPGLWMLPYSGDTGLGPTRTLDVYGALPFYKSDSQSPPPPIQYGLKATNSGWMDNQYLYYNPASSSTSPHHNYFVEVFGDAYGLYSEVRVGIINPPGTTENTGSGWLAPMPPLVTFGPFGACTNPIPGVGTYSVGIWCFNDTPSGCPDTVLSSNWWGIRVNCDYATLPYNLQTFLVVAGPPPAGRSSGSSSTPFPPVVKGEKMTLEELVKRLKGVSKIPKNKYPGKYSKSRK